MELLGLHNQLGLVPWQVGTTSPVAVGVSGLIDVWLPEQMIHEELVNPGKAKSKVSQQAPNNLNTY